MAAVRFDKGEKVGTGRGFFRHYVLALPAVKCPWKEKNEFTLRLNDGKLTWTVNGVKIHENAKVESPSADARVGFGSFRHFADVEISLLNLEVRRLPSTTEPGAAQKEPETDLDDPAVDRSLNLKN